MLMYKDSIGRSLVADAAFSGDKTTFETVLKAVHEKLGPEQVNNRLLCV